MKYRHIALFVISACLGAALGHATPTIVPYGMSDGKSVKANTVPTTLLSGPITCDLPTGASTSALQTSGNTYLSSLDTKTPALVSGRQPVDGSGVTQPVSGTFWQTTQPVSGPATDAQLRASPIPVSGTVTCTPSGTQTVQGTVAVSSVSGNVATTGAASSQADGHSANLGTLADASSANTLTGLLKAIKAALQGTVAVSSATLPLPSGASTSALQTSGNASLTTIAANTPAVGQTTMASSSPVVIASNQSAIPVTGTFYQATQPVSAAFLPLPTGAATDATLTGGSAIAIAKGAAAAGAGVSGNPVYVGGKDTAGNAQPIAVDTTGHLVPARHAFSYFAQTLSANTQVCTGACTLWSINVSTLTAGGAATVYNNTSCTGAVFAVITPTGTVPFAISYGGAILGTGICVTSSNSSITVIYDSY